MNKMNIDEYLLLAESGELTPEQAALLQNELEKPENETLRRAQHWIRFLSDVPPAGTEVDVPQLPELNRERILAAGRVAIDAEKKRTSTRNDSSDRPARQISAREKRIAKLQLWAAAAAVLAFGLLALRPWEQAVENTIAIVESDTTVEELLDQPFLESVAQLDEVEQHLFETSLAVMEEDEEEELAWMEDPLDLMADPELNALAALLLDSDGA